MEINSKLLAIVAILVGLSGIASNAIGLNDIKKGEHPTARNYLTINLIINIMFIIGAGGYLWLSYKSGAVAQTFKLF